MTSVATPPPTRRRRRLGEGPPRARRRRSSRRSAASWRPRRLRSPGRREGAPRGRPGRIRPRRGRRQPRPGGSGPTGDQITAGLRGQALGRPRSCCRPRRGSARAGPGAHPSDRRGGSRPSSRELARQDVGGRFGHQADARGRLRKRDDVAQRGRAGRDGADAVEAEGDAAVRRRAVLERFEEEPEALAPLLRRNAEHAEDAFLEIGAVNPDGTRTELPAVDDDVVGPGAHASGVGLQALEVFLARSRERVVHGEPLLPSPRPGRGAETP